MAEFKTDGEYGGGSEASSPPDSNSGDNIISPPNLDYERRFDPDQNAWYYLSLVTGESFWALDDPNADWMEAYDEASQCRYHLHSVSGETKWADDELSTSTVATTVWEELKDPVTGHHYYYSNVSSF